MKKDLHLHYFTKEEMDMLLPIVTEGQSDSACLDNMIELLTLCRPITAACNDDADPGSMGW